MKYKLLLLALFFANVIIAQSPLFQELKYRSVGPLRGGRATTVAGVPSQSGTFYMGATGGGVWKSTDYGVAWTNVSDGFFASPSIGAIRVADSNPNIVYVGSGSDGIRSNVIPGKGVYKSTDGGKKWTFLGLEKTAHIGAVEIHPSNPDVVFVAAIGNAFAPNPERGVFRTKDGGKNWEKVLYINDTIGVADLEFAPDDPNTIYAAAWRVERKPWTIISGGKGAGGIYKSTDGGNTWKKVEKGLPTGLIGKIDFAVAKSNPNRLWALVEAPQGEGGVFRSDDRGESFTLVSTKKELLDRPFYYCNIDANPLNADVIYVSSTSFWKSTDGGKNWRSMRVPHGDTHDLWINPNDTLIMVECNDGGANVSTNGGRTWSTQFNQPTAELYQVEVDDQFPYWLYAGQQDNYTTISVPSLPPRTAQAGANAYIMDTGGCETGPAVPKPGNPNIVYSNCKGNFGVYNKLTGQEMNYYVGAANLYGHHPKDLTFRFQRVAPIHVSPHNPDVVYHCSQYVHKTTDDGKTWEIISPDLTGYSPNGQGQVISGFPITRDITGEEYYSTIYEINESKIQEGLIWVGANDGPIHVTKNGGKTWENVTPKDLPGGGRVDGIDPSPHKPGKAYAAILRYQLGDSQPYIYKTEDYGKSWTRITNGIPNDYPVRMVREDPDREGLLYAGTEFGMFISFDDGKNWQPFQLNLPVTPITDIKVYRKDLVLSTMGRGFWILDNLTPLHELNNNQNTTALAVSEEAYRLRYRGNSPDEVPHYPAPGVTIDYYLAKDVMNEIKLDILDGGGKVIRSFSGGKGAGNASGERDMQTNFVSSGSGLSLNNKAGLHRVNWDLRHEGAWDAQRPGFGGPTAAPGMYEIRLTVDGQSYSDNFFLRMDPRLQESGVKLEDLRMQEELTLQVRDLLSDAKKVSDAVEKHKAKLEEQIKNSKKTKDVEKAKQELAQINKLYNELEMEEGRYMMPKLLNQIQYLNSMINQADQRPGKDAFDQYQNLVKQLNVIKDQWNKLNTKA